MKSDGHTRPATDSEPAADRSADRYRIGDTVRGLYRIVEKPIETGGFGRVYHVHHTGWDVDLAMKQPKSDISRGGQEKVMHINECDIGLNLGLHPHIVSCYYVREIDGVPSIFSEWMDGASLKDWIYAGGGAHDPYDSMGEIRKHRPGRLYDGGEKAALERILNIAIQFARGLRYAHKQGVIHQDVKPSNLLMTVGGTAKVADFGIADTDAAARRNPARGEDGVEQAAPFTPAYCSPEQMNRSDRHGRAGRRNRPLTIHTDIWSWAVSVMEMFLCGRRWSTGVAAGVDCDEFFAEALIPVPEQVKDLLRHCFRFEAAERPDSFAEIEARLCEIYQAETGRFYVRPESKAAIDTADSLNNRALSYLDIGMTGEAELCWEKALEKQPDHLDSIFNKTVHLWRSARIDDVQAADTLRNMYENHPDSHDAAWLYACLCMERRDYRTAVQLLNDRKESFRDRKYSSFLHAVTQSAGRQDCRILSDRLEYTGRLHMADGGAAVVSCSEKGLEKWALDRSPEGVPRGATQTGKHAWEWVQARVFRFSDDGKYVLTLEGKEDGGGRVANGKAICLWSVGECRCLRRFVSSTFRSSGPKDACFGTGNAQVLTVAWDGQAEGEGELRVWDAGSGQCLTAAPVGERDVSAVSFSPDGRSFATAAVSGRITLHDARDGARICTFDAAAGAGKEPPPAVRSLHFAPDGSVAALCAGGAFRLWSAAGGRPVRAYGGGFGRGVHFFPDSRHVHTASPAFRLIDLASGRCLHTADGLCPDADVLHLDREHALTTAAVDSDGSKKGLMLVTLPDLDGAPPVRWALSRIVNTRELEERQRRFRQIVAEARTCIQRKDIGAALKYLDRAFGISSVHRLTRQKLSDDIGRYCRIRGIRSLTQERTVGKTGGRYAFGPDGLAIVDGRLYDAIGGKYRHRFEETPRIYTFGHDGRHVYGTAGERQRIDAFDVQSGKRLYAFNPAHDGAVNSLAVSRDGKYLLTGSDDGTARLWNIGRRTCTQVFAHDGEVRSAFFGPDARTVVTLQAPAGRRQGDAFVWRVREGERQTLRQDVCSIGTGHDGTKLLLGLPGGLDVVDLRTLETLATCRHRTDPHYCATDVQFLPDERYALTSGSPGAICAWDIAAGKHLLSLLNDSIHLSIHPGGNYALGYAARCYLIRLDHLYEFPGWAKWDEGARPCLENFLARHPDWTDGLVEKTLLPDLQNRGYGWLTPEGVTARLTAIHSMKK
ncbi:MAG: protein kinase [Tannerella sp.]|jgi:serine/threonine protein kinase/WD40 repeat protein|nr:protein kinase [Tannerella sp.]